MSQPRRQWKHKAKAYRAPAILELTLPDRIVPPGGCQREAIEKGYLTRLEAVRAHGKRSAGHCRSTSDLGRHEGCLRRLMGGCRGE